jgi:hypothetical protein
MNPNLPSNKGVRKKSNKTSPTPKNGGNGSFFAVVALQHFGANQTFILRQHTSWRRV